MEVQSKLFFTSFLSFFFIFSSFVYVGFCDDDELISDQSYSRYFLTDQGGNNGGAPQMECVQKLLPCKPYLKSPSPPATCCFPLKEMVVNETQCLCGVIGNPAILQSLNITKDDAVNLAKNCGANADLSVCKNATSPTISPVTPSAPPAANTTNSSSPAKSSAEDGKSNFGGFGFIAVFTVLIASAF